MPDPSFWQVVFEISPHSELRVKWNTVLSINKIFIFICNKLIHKSVLKHLQINIASHISLKEKRALNMILGNDTNHIYFLWVSLMLNSSMGNFFASNASIVHIDFAIRMKCGLMTKHKTFTELFFTFLLHINKNCLSFCLLIVVMAWTSCRCRVLSTSLFLLPAKLSLEESGFPDLFLRIFGASQECLASPLDLPLQCCWPPRSFCSAQTSFVFEFFCQLQICFAVGSLFRKLSHK